MESNNIKNGGINLNTKKYINNEFYYQQKEKWLHTNDIVMVQSGDVGQTAVIPSNLNNTAAHALIMFQEIDSNINPYFLNYQFQSYRCIKQIQIISKGNTVKHVLASDMKEFTVFLASLKEQINVADFLNKLNRIIDLYERKLQLNLKLYAELLKQFIPDKNSKSILNKINWQSISLGKIAHLQKGKQKNRNDISEVRNDKETYPVYNGGKEKSGYTDEYNRNDSIIISEGGNSAGYVNYVAGKFYSGGHNYSIEPQNIDSSLLYLILLRNQSRIMNLRTGSGLPNIKISSLNSFKIFIPLKNDNLYDFDKILILFTKDNNLIKDKLNKLKLIKKTLLNTMFI